MQLPSKQSPAGVEYLVLGIVAMVIGALCLHAYFELSGRDKPFYIKLLPGS